MGRLQEKVAVITGGSTGMGLSTAQLFVREGAKVVITGRDRSALDAAVRTIGTGSEALVSDISKLADIGTLRAFVQDRYGRFDILFANAGGGRPGAFETVTEDDFDFGSEPSGWHQTWTAGAAVQSQSPHVSFPEQVLSQRTD